MRTRLRLLAPIAALVVALALAFTPGQADARAGFGSSFGSRGSQTWSAPPATNTAPYTSPMQRSMTPGGSSYGSGAYGGYRGGFGSGLLGGLLGFGLAGLLMGHGFMGFGMFGLFGLLIRIVIIVTLVRWLLRMFRGPSPMYAGSPAMFAPGGGMAGGMGGPMGGGPMMGGGRRGVVPIAIAPADYQAFEQVLRNALDQSPMRICPFAVMPNRWRLLLLILFTISNGSESPEMAVHAGYCGLRKPLRDQALDNFRASAFGSKSIRKSCHYCHFGRFFRGVE